MEICFNVITFSLIIICMVFLCTVQTECSCFADVLQHVEEFTSVQGWHQASYSSSGIAKESLTRLTGGKFPFPYEYGP